MSHKNMPLSVTGSNPAIDPGPASGESTFGTGVLLSDVGKLGLNFSCALYQYTGRLKESANVLNSWGGQG